MNENYSVGREELLFFTGKHDIFSELKNEQTKEN